MQALSTVEELDSLSELYPVGSGHTLVIAKHDEKKHVLQLTRPGATFETGSTVIGIVDHLLPKIGVKFQLGASTYGLALLTDLADTFASHPLKVVARMGAKPC